MSTLSGIVSKGEKGKTKYQSIDINSLYRSSRGESLEQHQQKSQVPRKHGMQTLGKVPSARRPPANLPSLKSETSSSDPAVSLVPSGGSGWATTKESTPTTNTTVTTTSNTPSDNTTTNAAPAQCTTGGGQTSALTSQQHPPLPGQQSSLQTSHSQDPGNKSSWSAIMSRPGDAVESGRGGVRGGAGLSFLAHQSPQFQHEFPSLSGQSSSSSSSNQQQQQQQQTNAITNSAQHQSMLQQQQNYTHNHAGGGPQGQQPQQNREVNAQYGPGPSLRPQTEGSWIQGGSRVPGGQAAGVAGVAGSGNIPGAPVPPGGVVGPAGVAPTAVTGGPGSGQPDGLNAGGRSNLGTSQGMAMAPGGQQQQPPNNQVPQGPNMHHYRGIIPPFMYRGGNFPGGNFQTQFPAGGPRPRFTPAERAAAQQQLQRQQQLQQQQQDREDEIVTRPIIKEEDLSRMDDISREAGWTATDDIDYNQKLAFSDDENDLDQSSSGHHHHKKEDTRKDINDKQDDKHAHDDNKDVNLREKDQKESSRNEPRNEHRNDVRNDMQNMRSWNNQGSRDYRGPPGPPPSNYPQSAMRPAHPHRVAGDEDELWNQRRSEQVSENIASAVERARQRKEEEEKRFQESTKQAAAKKLQDLENKLKEKRKKDEEHKAMSEGSGKSSTVTTPSTIIPVPEWERDNRERSRTLSSDGATSKDLDIKSSGRDQQQSAAQGPQQQQSSTTSEFRQIDRPFIRQQQQQQSGNDQSSSSSSTLPPGGNAGGGPNNMRDRDQREMREPAFSRHFQSNLPPRFQKQQAERSGASGVGSNVGGSGSGGPSNNRLSPSAERSQPVSFSQQYDPSRWAHNHSNSLSGSIKSSHSMPPPRRTRADSDVSGPLDDDRDRPPSRNPPSLRSDDRHRHSGHRSGGYDSRKQGNDGYYDDYPRGGDRRGGGDRYKDDRYDYDDRHGGRWADDEPPRSGRGGYDEKVDHRDGRDGRDGRDIRDSRDMRDLRERDSRDKKDYDSYSKNSRDYDDREQDVRDRRDDNSGGPEWREDRRDLRSHDDSNQRRSGGGDRSNDDLQQQQQQPSLLRSERPQRPDSRDSRTSRESRTSLRGDDDFHKSSTRETGSWADSRNDFSDYEEQQQGGKMKRDIFREDHRDRDRDREGPPPPRDRRQPGGPVTKDKLEHDEPKRHMTSLKRLDLLDKKDSKLGGGGDQTSSDSKKDEPWNRNKSADSSAKTNWADAVSPTVEMEEEEKRMMDSHDDGKMSELKQSLDKLSIDGNKRSSSDLDADKDDQKDDKRDKNARNRTGSGSSRGPRGNEPRGARQWGSGSGSSSSVGTGASAGSGNAAGAFNSSYSQRGWRGSEPPPPPSRGGRRAAGGPRSMGERPRSGKGGYERTDSELSGDEPNSASNDLAKDDRRPANARSPKPQGPPKGDKDERNRNAVSSRKDEQLPSQQQSGYGQAGSRGEKRGGAAEQHDSGTRGGGSGRPGREGFAPSGEPSRRGRGGFRNNGTRGSSSAPTAAPTAAGGGGAGSNSSGAASGRIEGYGPPPSKSPFSSDRSDDKHSGSGGQHQSSTPSQSEHEEGGNASNQSESVDEKMMAKQQALTAGITGSKHSKSPSQLGGANHNDSNANPRPKKDDTRAKRTRSGSRRARGGGRSGASNKQNSMDPNNEDWDTTSENSEEHMDDKKDGHGRRSNKPFERRGERQNANAVNNNPLHGRDSKERIRDSREPRGEPRGDKGPKSANPPSSRGGPGSEKGRNAQNLERSSGNRDGSQRNHHSGGMQQPLMQNTQTQNGRPRSQGSANSGPISNIKNIINKDTTVNRIDDIKLNDPNAVNQALNDINSKAAKEKRGVVDMDVDGNCIGGDDVNMGDDKIDADGFQEVRSKKNVKDSSRQQQKDEQASKSGRRGERDKDKRDERDRSKSKANGAQSQQQQQQSSQSIPPLMGQPIGQAGSGAPPKQYERNANRQKLAPRFQKQRLAKMQQGEGEPGKPLNPAGTAKDSAGGVPPPPAVNAWDKPFTGSSSRSPPSPAVASVPADVQLMSGLTPQVGADHDANQSERNSPNVDKVVSGKLAQVKDSSNAQDKSGADTSSPPVQTLIFENTNYQKNTKSSVGSAGDMAIKSKYSNHIKTQSRDKRSSDMDDESAQLQQHQQQALAAAFSNKPNELMKDKLPSQQEPIQMPLSFNNKEDTADMKLDFTFDSDLSQLTEDKSKSLGLPRSMHMTGGQSTISPSTAELNLKIASVKKVWETAPPMPTVVEHEVDSSVVSSANSFPQAFESNDVDDGYSAHQQYSQGNMKNEISTSTNVCKLVPPQVKPQQQASAGAGGQPGSSVQGPSPIGPGQSPIGHPPASLQGPLSPPPFNSTGQPSHINYQEFAQYPGSQAAAAQYGSMSAIPSPPAVLFNTGSGQLPAQAAGSLYGAFQLDQSRSPFTQYPPYAASLQSSFNQQNMYMQQAPPPHAPNAPAPDIYQNNLSQYRLTAAAAPPFGQNQQLSNNPNTVLISSSSNSLMSASVKPSSQTIGAIGTKAPHYQAPSAPPQPNQLAYIPYDPNQVLGVSGSYMGNSQMVQRPGPTVQPSANNYYSATSADVFSGSQTGFYQPGGAAQQTGAHYSLQGFGQHSQSLATGNAAPVGLQNFSSQFLSGSGLQIAAAAAAQQYRNQTGGLPGPANAAAATFLNKHQQQEQPRQLKSPSGNQQDVLASVFSSSSQIPSPKSRKQQSASQQPQPSPTQHHKFQQYQGVSQSALVSSYNNYQNVQRGMGMQQRGSIQPSQQRYPPPIQRPVVPFPPGPNNAQQGQQQQNCMPNQQQQQQQNQMSRHRPNIHQQQQQQQRNMKMQQQYYSGQSNVKMDSNEKVDSHNEKISDNSAGNQTGVNKANANPPENDNKEEVIQQNE